MKKLFPAVIVLMYVGAAIANAIKGDWRQVLYSICAAGLNLAVFF
jgi:hypothetical protein